VTPRPVIFSPDLLAASLFDLNCRKVILRWREGSVTPVLNRELLILYLRLLGQAGVSAELLKAWTCWLTSPEWTRYLHDVTTNERAPKALCNNLATRVPGVEILCWSKQSDAGNGSLLWRTANEFLESSG
jgi:hypothetical protein